MDEQEVCGFYRKGLAVNGYSVKYLDGVVSRNTVIWADDWAVTDLTLIFYENSKIVKVFNNRYWVSVEDN